MKPLFFCSFLFLSLFFNTAYSQCNWEDLGRSDTNTIRNQAINYWDMALDANNHSYKAFGDGDENEKITVRKYENDIWTTLGTAGFSVGIASFVTIDVDNNNIPYVAYCDYGAGDKVIVKQFDGTNWVQVGSPLSTTSAAYTSLFIDDNDIPYVAFQDTDNGNKVTVKKFDGSNWILVGNAGFSSGIANYVSLTIDNTGVPFVVYQDGGNADKAIVKKYNGSSWVTLGPEGFTTGVASHTKIAVNSLGEPTVSFSDENNGDKLTVMEFDGTNWEILGSPMPQGYYSSIAFDSNDIIHLVYLRSYTGTIKAIKYNATLEGWYSLGNGEFYTAAKHVSIQIGSNGIPYISFRSYGTMSVWKCVNYQWKMLGVPGFSAGKTSYNTHMAISSTGIPFVAYVDKTDDNSVVVNRYVGNQWEKMGYIVGKTSAGNESFSIALDTNDVPYVVYTTTTSNLRVSKFNGTSWTSMPSIGYNSNTPGDYCDIVINPKTNQPLISYRSLNSAYNNSYEKIEFRMFDHVNQYWTQGGSLTGDLALVKSKQSSIAVDTSGNPYVAFTNQSNGTVVVRKLTVSNKPWATWSNVGPSYTINTNSSMTLDLAISPDNVPYIVYEDVTAGNQIVVQRFNGANWEIVGTAGFSAGKAYNTAITFDAGGTPYVSFGDEANGDKITVMKFDGVDWLTVGSAGFSGEKVVSLGRTSTTSIGVAPNGNIYAAYYNNGYLAAKKFNSTTSTDYQTVCDSELPVIWNGVNYDTTGTYQYTSTNIAGCDSTATLFLSVKPIITGGDTITACGSHTWIDNITYTQSNSSAVHTIIGGAVNGCDSIVTLNLTIKQLSTGIDTQTACESFTWIDNNTYTQSNSTAVHTIIGGAANGCDSIVTLNLTINQPSTGIDTQTACEGCSLVDNNTYTQRNYTAVHTINGAAVNGCDSIVTLNLTIKQPSTSIENQTACESFTWIDNINYTQSNSTAVHTIIGGAANGCDSIVTLNLTVNQPSSGIDTQTVCESFTWIDNNTYTQSNTTATHTIVGGANNGCDSIVTLNLTVINMNPTVMENSDFLSPSYNNGDLYEWIDCNSEIVVFTGKDFYPNGSGEFKVKITKEGCVETSDCIHFSPLSVNYNTIDDLVIYPNPTTNILYVKGVKVESIRVLGINGKELISNLNTNYIRVGQLSSGSYFIEINGTTLKMFVKQ